MAVPVRAAGARLHTPQGQAVRETEKTTALKRREESRLVTATKVPSLWAESMRSGQVSLIRAIKAPGVLRTCRSFAQTQTIKLMSAVLRVSSSYQAGGELKSVT